MSQENIDPSFYLSYYYLYNAGLHKIKILDIRNISKIYKICFQHCLEEK